MHSTDAELAALDRDANGRTRHDYADDPEAYIREVLGVKLWSKQIEIVRKIQTNPYRCLVRAGHSIGKSFLAACLMSWHFDSFPKSHTILTGPTQMSVQDIVFSEFRRMRRGDPRLLPKAAVLYDNEDHHVKGFTASRGESFSGRHLARMGFLFDEATALGKDYFDAGRSMFNGTPEMFWLCFFNPIDISSYVYEEESKGDWHSVIISQFEHPNILAELKGDAAPYPGAVRLAQLIANMDAGGERLRPDADHQSGEVSFLTHVPGCPPDVNNLRWMPGPDAYMRILGQWPTAGGSTVWSQGLWDKVCATRHELNPLWNVWIGLDVAAWGADQSVFVVKQGPCILHTERHSAWGTKQSCARLKELCDQFKGPPENVHTRGNPKRVRCMVDAGGGWSSGILDYADGHDFQPVNSSWVARNEELYHNTRSELWFIAKAHADAGLLDISRMPEAEKRRLRAELFAATYMPDSKDRFTVCSKEDQKAVLAENRSPDFADALNLACYGHSM